MLRPVAPGHVAVRPRPTDRRPEAWCCVTLGPVKHYVRHVEVDVNPDNPEILLYAYEFVGREIALYAARQILKNGWLATCGEPYPEDLAEKPENDCLLPLGHREECHSNGYYRWGPYQPPVTRAPKRWIDLRRSLLDLCREHGKSHFRWDDSEIGRCAETEPYGTDAVRCQLLEGHEGTYHVHQNREYFLKWLDKTTADRMLGR